MMILMNVRGIGAAVLMERRELKELVGDEDNWDKNSDQGNCDE
jgi:hypothetical protein